MYMLWIAIVLLIVALIVSVLRYYRPKKLPLREDVDVRIAHITRGDVRFDIERKPKRMKSRSRKKT
jgi:hypothetical protein